MCNGVQGGGMLPKAIATATTPTPTPNKGVEQAGGCDSMGNMTMPPAGGPASANPQASSAPTADALEGTNAAKSTAGSSALAGAASLPGGGDVLAALKDVIAKLSSLLATMGGGPAKGDDPMKGMDPGQMTQGKDPMKGMDPGQHPTHPVHPIHPVHPLRPFRPIVQQGPGQVPDKTQSNVGQLINNVQMTLDQMAKGPNGMQAMVDDRMGGPYQAPWFNPTQQTQMMVLPDQNDIVDPKGGQESQRELPVVDPKGGPDKEKQNAVVDPNENSAPKGGPVVGDVTLSDRPYRVTLAAPNGDSISLHGDPHVEIILGGTTRRFDIGYGAGSVTLKDGTKVSWDTFDDGSGPAHVIRSFSIDSAGTEFDASVRTNDGTDASGIKTTLTDAQLAELAGLLEQYKGDWNKPLAMVNAEQQSTQQS